MTPLPLNPFSHLAPSRSALVDLADRLADLQRHRETHLLDTIRWTPPQLDWLKDHRTRKLLRAGNQIGKTWAGLAEVIYRALGTHPFYGVRPPPVEIWILCTSWSQSVQIMGKFRDLVPKDRVRKMRWDQRTGFGKDNPAVVFDNGSIVRFKTTEQGEEALQGGTIDYVLIDEPCPPEMYRELDRRVMRRAGGIGLTLTPLNRPCDWLRELCEAEVVWDHHAKLIAENLIPVGRKRPLPLLDGTPMDQTWINEQWRITPERYAGVVLDGDWEGRVQGAVFSRFDPAVHVVDDDPTADLKLCIGYDWGERDFKNVAILAQVDSSGEFPKVHVIDEYVGEEDTTPEAVARETLAMLARHGWTWSDVDFARGDKPHDSVVNRKSNTDIEGALKKRLKPKNGRIVPTIRQAKAGKGGGRGSVERGCTWLHQCMVRPGHFTVNPRCTRLIEGLQKWDYRPDSPHKDPCDALRYSVWDYAMGHQGGVRAPARPLF